MTKGTALITGGSRRIGADIATHLAEKGYTIALHYNTSENDAEKLLHHLQLLRPQSRMYQCDLNDLSAVESLMLEVYTNHPDLTVLINNASVFEKFSLIDTNSSVVKRDMNIHYIAPFLLIRDFAKHVKKGVIINMLDGRLRRRYKGNASYVISKNALLTLTEIAAVELAPDIRVNAVAPGVILPPPGASEKYVEKLAKSVPLGRAGTLQEVTDAVDTLVTGEYLTGNVLYLDGGMYL